MKQPQSEAKLHALDYWQVIRNRYGVILLSFFLVFMTAAVVTAIMPKKFAGKVMLEVERYTGSGLALENPHDSYKGMSSPLFLQTEFKIITSKEDPLPGHREARPGETLEPAKSRRGIREIRVTWSMRTRSAALTSSTSSLTARTATRRPNSPIPLRNPMRNAATASRRIA